MTVRLGIGTNNPLNILTLHQAAGANIRFQNATTGRYFIVGEGVGANDKFSFRGNSYRSTDTLTVDFANNRVGVNNISPSKTLDVHGDIWLGASGTSILGGAGDIHIYADNAKVEEYWTSGSDYMFKSYHDDIRYPALGTKGMSIGSDVAPRAILDITGNNSTGMFNAGLGTRTISGTQSFALAPAGTVTVSGNESGMIGSCSSVTVSGNRTLVMGLDNTLAIGTVSTSSILSIMGGSVGIGTTNPSQKLYVHGNIVVNAQILTPGGSNLALNPNTGLVTVGGALQTTSWLTVGGALTASSLATSAATGVVATAAGGGWNPAFHSKNTNADSAPSYITLEKISASPAVSDYIGGIVMKGRTSTGVHRSFVEQWCVATNVTNGSEGARWNCGTWKLGVEYPATLVCAGNDVGIGVVPTAVSTSHDSLQIGGNANIQSYGTKGASGEVDYCHNVYLNQDGNYKLISADEGTMYRQGAGKHQFYSWASGTAGSNVSVNAAARLVNIEASGNATFTSIANLHNYHYINVTTAGKNPILGFVEAGTRRAYINYVSADNYLSVTTEEGSSDIAIMAAGKVGVGTTNPENAFEVKKSVTGSWVSRIYNPATTGNPYGLLVRVDKAAAADTHFGVYNGTKHTFAVKGDGKVGIGTAAPGALLDSDSNVGWSSGWRNNLRLTSDYYPCIRFYSQTINKTSLIGNNNDGGLWFGVNGSGDAYSGYGMVIRADGNVGIGVHDPGFKLEVVGRTYLSDNTIIGRNQSMNPRLVLSAVKSANLGKADTGMALCIDSGASDAGNSVGHLAQIGLGLINAYQPAAIGAMVSQTAAYTSTHLVFATRPTTTDVAPTERMRIQDDGNVGIGTTDPSYALDVNGTGRFTGALTGTSATLSAAAVVRQGVLCW